MFCERSLKHDVLTVKLEVDLNE